MNSIYFKLNSMQPEENKYGMWENCLLDFDNLLEDDKVVFVVHIWKTIEGTQLMDFEQYDYPILTHHKWTKISDIISGLINQNDIDTNNLLLSVHEYSSYEEAFEFAKDYSESLYRPVE